jgi:hypothetical protein
MFANSQMMGLDTGFPDVCLTPTPAGPVPIPYPAIGAGPMGVPAAYTILSMMTPTHNLTTTIPMTNGDNAGVALGVASGTVMGPTRPATGAFTVLVQGAPVTRLTSVNIGNTLNNPVTNVRSVPSQIKWTVLSP